MKLLYFIIALSISELGFLLKTDTTRPQATIKGLDGSVWVDNYDTLHYRIFSLAPVIMLVSDTGVTSIGTDTYYINGWLKRTSLLTQQLLSGTKLPSDSLLGMDYKPLNKNLVVWMYRNRKE